MFKNIKELPFVSVIIPTYNDWDRLNKCLKALSNQTYPHKKFEVIIINNNSLDYIPDKIKNYNYSIVTESTVGSYAARNTGISLSKGDILAFTDSDCIPDTFWIERAINKFNEGCDRIAGHIDIFPTDVNPNIAELYDMTFGFDQQISAMNGLSVTANMFARKSLFDEYGKFKSSLFSGGDTEWSRRVHSKGIGINYEPEVIVRHPARKSLKDLFNKRYRVSAKKSIIYVQKLKKNPTPKFMIYKKRMLYLFFSKHSLHKGIAVIIVAFLLKLYSILVKFFFNSTTLINKSFKN